MKLTKGEPVEITLDGRQCSGCTADLYAVGEGASSRTVAIISASEAALEQLSAADPAEVVRKLCRWLKVEEGRTRIFFYHQDGVVPGTYTRYEGLFFDSLQGTAGAWRKVARMKEHVELETQELIP